MAEAEDARLPAHLEVAGMIRRVQAAGGFATVTAKGDREAGTILAITTCNGKDYRAWERMPQADGRRIWQCAAADEQGYGEVFSTYLNRRKTQDADLWIVELDVADAAQLVGFARLAG
jgi:hypothetical protein